MARTYNKTLYFATVDFDDSRYEADETMLRVTIPKYKKNREESDATYHCVSFVKPADHTDDWGNYIPVVDVIIEGTRHRIAGPETFPWGDHGDTLSIQINWDRDGYDEMMTSVDIFVHSAPIPIEEEDC